MRTVLALVIVPVKVGIIVKQVEARKIGEKLSQELK